MANHDSSAVFRTLHIPNFRNYMAGNFISQAGMWVQRIAVGWLTWELYHGTLGRCPCRPHGPAKGN
jgi:hypothetical protein